MVRRSAGAIVVKAATLRRYTSVHTWTGITTGILLFVAFYAGSLIMFKDALEDWANPSHRAQIERALAGERHDGQAIVDAVRGRDRVPEAFNLILTPNDWDAPWGNWRKPEATEPRDRWVLLDPQGPPRDSSIREISRVPEFIEEIHYTMGLPLTFGTYLFGLVTLVYGVALVSGLVIHFPHMVKDLFKLRLGRNRKLLWQDAHNIVGVLSLPFHLMFVVTSLLLTVSIVAILGTNLFTLDNQLERTSVPKLTELSAPRPEDHSRAPVLPLAKLTERARTEVPGMTPTVINYHHAGEAMGTATVRGTIDRSLARFVAVELDAATGEVLGVDKPGDRNPGLVTASTITSLHYGRFAHGAADVLLRLSYLVLGLLGAFMFYSGNLLWIETRRKRRQPQQPRHHLWLARLTVGACIGSMLGISAMLLAAKLLPADMTARVQWEQSVWYVVLFASLAWTAVRPPTRAAVELLWACALVTLWLPVANALTTALPIWAAASHGVWGVFGVDLGAIVLAIGFALLARATARRLSEKRTVGVWAESRGA